MRGEAVFKSADASISPESNLCTDMHRDGAHDSAELGESVQALQPCTLELFAGSCKLSKCLKLHGFFAIGIDHKKCRKSLRGDNPVAAVAQVCSLKMDRSWTSW